MRLLAVQFGPLITTALLFSSLGCGKRAPYEIVDPASISGIKKGTTNCSKSACEKLQLDLNVTVPPPGIHNGGSRLITIPAESSTEIRFAAKVDAKNVTRHAAILVKSAPDWMKQDSVSAGSVTLKATPPAGATSGSITFQIRDVTYCSATSPTPEECRSPSLTVDSDVSITFQIAIAPPGMTSNGVYVLPSENLCVKPPSQMEQTVSGLQQGVSTVSSLLSGNFVSVITNITSSMATSQQANQAGKREGC